MDDLTENLIASELKDWAVFIERELRPVKSYPRTVQSFKSLAKQLMSKIYCLVSAFKRSFSLPISRVRGPLSPATSYLQLSNKEQRLSLPSPSIPGQSSD